jgi:hypothetical protein
MECEQLKQKKQPLLRGETAQADSSLIGDQSEAFLSSADMKQK